MAQLSLQRIRFVIWGEALGLLPSPDGISQPHNRAEHRADIKAALWEIVNDLLSTIHICLQPIWIPKLRDQFDMKTKRKGNPSAEGSVDTSSLTDLQNLHFQILLLCMHQTMNVREAPNMEFLAI